MSCVCATLAEKSFFSLSSFLVKILSPSISYERGVCSRLCYFSCQLYTPPPSHYASACPPPLRFAFFCLQLRLLRDSKRLSRRQEGTRALRVKCWQPRQPATPPCRNAPSLSLSLSYSPLCLLNRPHLEWKNAKICTLSMK